MYANGEGVPEDYAVAYMWADFAAARGSETVQELKGPLADRITREQIAEAQRLSGEWLEKRRGGGDLGRIERPWPRLRVTTLRESSARRRPRGGEEKPPAGELKDRTRDLRKGAGEGQGKDSFVPPRRPDAAGLPFGWFAGPWRGTDGTPYGPQ